MSTACHASTSCLASDWGLAELSAVAEKAGPPETSTVTGVATTGRHRCVALTRTRQIEGQGFVASEAAAGDPWAVVAGAGSAQGRRVDVDPVRRRPTDQVPCAVGQPQREVGVRPEVSAQAIKVASELSAVVLLSGAEGIELPSPDLLGAVAWRHVVRAAKIGQLAQGLRCVSMVLKSNGARPQSAPLVDHTGTNAVEAVTIQLQTLSCQ